MEFEPYIAVAVAQALDDLDERRLTVEQALTMVAQTAYLAGREDRPAHFPERFGAPETALASRLTG